MLSTKIVKEEGLLSEDKLTGNLLRKLNLKQKKYLGIVVYDANKIAKKN
jgi:hypothetical protein